MNLLNTIENKVLYMHLDIGIM